MKTYSIRAEGIELELLPGTEHAAAIDALAKSYETLAPELIARLRPEGNLRVCLVAQGNKKRAKLLWWPPGTEVQAIERRAETASVLDADFAPSLRAHGRWLLCRGSPQHNVLCIYASADDPYLGAKGLLEEKLKNARSSLCPLCKSSFGQIVLELASGADQPTR